MDWLKKHFINGDGEVNWKNLFLTALGAWGGYGLVVWLLSESINNAGLFGDMFGGINALFSGLALIGVVVAIFYQRSELKLQREELQLTREEMSGQTEVFNRQRFQDSFFHLLKFHNEFTTPPGGLGKPPVINTIRSAVKGYDREAQNLIYTAEERKAVFLQYYEDNKEEFGLYLFRLETLLMHINSSEIDDKDFFIRVIRGCMDDAEVRFVQLAREYTSSDFTVLRMLSKEYYLLEEPDEIGLRNVADFIPEL